MPIIENPGSPINFAGIAGNKQVTLTWNEPTSNGGYDIIYYTITVSTGEMITLDYPTNFYILTDLENGTKYSFKIKATNINSSSFDSGLIYVTPATVPDAPLTISGKAGKNSATLKWIDASNGGSNITSYNLLCINTQTHLVESSFNLIYHNITVNNLTNGVRYSFDIMANNIFGTSNPTNTFVIPANVPSSLDISGISGNEKAIINWNEPNNNGSGIMYYNVYCVTLNETVTVYYPTNAYIFSDLSNNTSYSFKVTAINNVGTSIDSSMVTITPSITADISKPGTPIGVSGISSNGEVILSWLPPIFTGGDGLDIINYNVKCVGPDTDLNTDVSLNTTTTFSGLTNGTAYQFQVNAKNSNQINDTSIFSQPIFVTPATVPDTPMDISVNYIDRQTIVSWTDGSDGGYPINSYTVNTNTGMNVSIASQKARNPFSSDQNSRMVKFPGLTIGQNYVFTVNSTNDVGTSLDSSGISFIPLGSPSAPLLLTGIPQNGEALLNWSTPLFDGGSDIISYKITCFIGNNIDSSFNITLNTENELPTSYVYPNLINGKTYKFIVNAINKTNVLSLNSFYVYVSPNIVPNAPGNVTGISSNKTNVVSWDASVLNGGTAITQYIVTSDNGTVASVKPTQNTVTFTNLTNGLEYTYRVNAVNIAGISLDSSSITLMPKTVPSAPIMYSVINDDIYTNVTWVASITDGGSPITGYKLRYVTGTTTTDISYSDVTTASLNLTKGLTYTFYVYAVNIIGLSTISNQKTFFNIIVPSQPTDLSSVSGNQQVSLSWTAPITNGGSAIKLYVVTCSNGKSMNVTTTTALFTGLTNGEQYTFFVNAMNKYGSSENSDSVTVLLATVPGIPNNFMVTPGNSLVNLSWMPPSSNGGSEITEYLLTYTWLDQSMNVSYNASDISGTIQSLQNGTEYTFILKALNSFGSSYSASSIVTPATVPEPPTLLSITPGDKQMTLLWDDSSNGGSSILSYQLVCTTTGVSATVYPPNKTYTFTNLVNSVSYTFTINATNIVGTSTSVTSSTVPAAFSIANIAVTNKTGANYQSATIYTMLDNSLNIISDGDPYPAKCGEPVFTNDGITTRSWSKVPNPLVKQSYNYTFQYRGGTPDISANQHINLAGGGIGFFANGVILYNQSSGTGTVPMTDISGGGSPSGYLNAIYFESVYGIDLAGGHPSPEGVIDSNGKQGQYHYHDSGFLLNNCWNNEIFYNSNLYFKTTSFAGDHIRNLDGHSKIVGVCFDGYPIYGPYGYQKPMQVSLAVLMTSSFILKETEFTGRPYRYTDKGKLLNTKPQQYLTVGPGAFINDYVYTPMAGSLDQYNGRFCVTPEYPLGTYAYFITVDSMGGPVFPYIVGTYTKQQRKFVKI